MSDMRAALLRACTEDRVEELGRQMLDAAIAGDWLAAKVLLPYLVGKPRQAPDPDTLDVAEVKALLELPRNLVRDLVSRVTPAVAVELARMLPNASAIDAMARDATTAVLHREEFNRAVAALREQAEAHDQAAKAALEEAEDDGEAKD
jgi:hypothetical protein